MPDVHDSLTSLYTTRGGLYGLGFAFAFAFTFGCAFAFALGCAEILGAAMGGEETDDDDDDDDDDEGTKTEYRDGLSPVKRTFARCSRKRLLKGSVCA